MVKLTEWEVDVIEAGVIWAEAVADVLKGMGWENVDDNMINDVMDDFIKEVDKWQSQGEPEKPQPLGGL